MDFRAAWWEGMGWEGGLFRRRDGQVDVILFDSTRLNALRYYTSIDRPNERSTDDGRTTNGTLHEVTVSTSALSLLLPTRDR